MNTILLLPFALWGLVTAILFSIVGPRRAVLVSYITGWLFLPHARFRIEGLPLFTKVSITSLFLAAFALLVDTPSFQRLRFQWLDVPIVVWCVVPLASSLANGLGLKDGILEVFNQTVTWGVPYLLGRSYFGNPWKIRELAVGIIVGGLAYVPLCLWEIRMSPGLHKALYGFRPSAFNMHVRFGGYRPCVFMYHGLAVGFWMATATVLATWLWITDSVRTIWRIRLGLCVPVLFVTTVLCKALGAIFLMCGGVAILFGTRWLRTRWLVTVLLLVPGVYFTVRIPNLWEGQPIVGLVRTYISAESAFSFQFRLEQENFLIAHALARPFVGWGGWGRHQVITDSGRQSKTDGLWIIALGKYGFVGLASMTGLLLLPAAVVLGGVPTSRFLEPLMAAPVGLAVIMGLHTIDNLGNAMLNPLFLLVAGALASVALTQRDQMLTAVGPSVRRKDPGAALRPGPVGRR